MRGLLIGNYGVGNLGDELLKKYFLEHFHDVQWKVLSAHPTSPHEVTRLPAGLRSLLRGAWRETVREFRTADVVVFGGGSLFTDVESPFACFLWWLHVRAACFFGKPVFLAFQGIGPFRTKRGEWFARDALRRAVFVSVRDEESMKRAHAFSMNIKIVQSFDPVLSLFLAFTGERTENVITIIPRRNSGQRFQDFLQVHMPSVSGPIQILSLQPEDPQEQVICRSLAQTYHATIVPAGDAATFLVAIAASAMVLTERYHGGLAALALGKPLYVCSQGTGDKLSTLPQGVAAVDWLRAMHERVVLGEDALRRALQSQPVDKS